MDNGYYILVDGEKTGPFSFQELTDQGLDIDTQVSALLADTWQNASYLPEFAEYFASKGFIFPTEDNLAGFGWRTLAFITDNIIVFCVVLYFLPYLGISFNVAKSIETVPVRTVIVINLIFAGMLLIYNTLFEASSMRGSIGKRICRLLVVDEDGRKLTVKKAFVRNFGVILSSTFYGLPFLTYFLNDRKQPWYDQLLKTYITKVSHMLKR